MTTKIKLSKPIKAHGETVNELTFEAPTLGAIDGIHLKVSGGGSVEFNLGDLAKIISNMANIPPSSAAQISLVDLAGLAEVVQGFLGDFLQTGGT